MKNAFVLTLALLSTAAAAQDDPMEAQRCVWRCLAESAGADDPAYGACVQSQCSSAPRAPASGRQAGAPRAAWVYGDHPVLGRGAFVQTAQGVVGLACGASGPPLDLRLTNGFFRGPALTVMFDDSPSAFSMRPASGPASQLSGEACTLDLAAFKGASTLYLINGGIAATSSDASGTVMTLQGNGQTVAVRTSAEAYRSLGGAAVSLTGSAAAIERLLAACPAARADAAFECGD